MHIATENYILSSEEFSVKVALCIQNIEFTSLNEVQD